MPAVREVSLPIAGEQVVTGDWVDVRSPYDDRLVGRVARGGRAETQRAVEAAGHAMTMSLPAHKRAEILIRATGVIGRRAAEIAELISAEAGKPLKAARTEVHRAMSTFTMAAVAARTLSGDVVPMDATQAGEGKLAFTVRVPAGIVGAITPFNFPLNLVAHKVAPAIAAGCGIVLKPASATPLSSLMLAELLAEAGLPDGWLNVVVGAGAEIGDVLVADERVRVLSFTGSAGVGWDLRERAPRKRVCLELGNSTPVIVAQDADLDAAADRCVAGAFAYAGQSCISVQRIYVHTDVYAPFTERLVAGAEKLIVGDPANEATDVGPLISKNERDRVLAWIEEARLGGARILAGGTLRAGLLLPTVVESPPPDARLSCEEAFGPVCTVQRYTTIDEAFDLANSSRYGLQAGIFTSSLDTALRAARVLEFGGIMVNEAPTFRADQMPYGGVKDSGNTREGPAYAVRELTEERLVVLDLPR